MSLAVLPQLQQQLSVAHACINCIWGVLQHLFVACTPSQHVAYSAQEDTSVKVSKVGVHEAQGCSVFVGCMQHRMLVV
jgi:hypothetical protein